MHRRNVSFRKYTKFQRAIQIEAAVSPKRNCLTLFNE